MPLSPIDASERGSPSTSPYLRTRSDETPERRSSRLLPLGALTPPRSALARVSTAAALICATLLALSFAFASDGARRTALRLLDPSDGCDACREASNTTARHQVGPTGAAQRPSPLTHVMLLGCRPISTTTDRDACC